MSEVISKEMQEKITSAIVFVKETPVFKITKQEEYDKVLEITKAVKKRLKEIEDERITLTKPLNDTIKIINGKAKEASEQLKGLESNFKSKMRDYINEQERIRIEEQRKRDETARREREKAEKEARERRQKEEEARRRAEEAERKAREEQDEAKKAELLKQAQKEKAKSDQEALKADAKEQIKDTVVAPVSAPKVEKKGVSVIKKWRVEITNKKEFIRGCIERGDLYYLDINTGMLNKEAQATKGEKEWRGAKVVLDTETRVRG